MDVRINNTLIEIIPYESKDRFKVSMAYLTTLNEIIDYRNYAAEEVDRLYEAIRPFKEVTAFTSIKDSAKYYFRALPHTADMEAVKLLTEKWYPLRKGIQNSR